jgi:MFS family permease
MTGLANGCDFDHKSQPLSSSRGRESPSDQQETHLSNQDPSRGVRHDVAASLQSALARQHTLQSSQRRANDDYTSANNGAPSSTPETDWPIVSRSSSNNSERRVGRLVKSEAQRSQHELISRSPSLNSERRLSSPKQLSPEGGLSRTVSLREQACVSRRSSLATLHETPNVAHPEGIPQLPPPPALATALPKKQLLRHSSLRHQLRPSSHGPEVPRLPFDLLNNSTPDHVQTARKVRPKSLPPHRSPAPGQFSSNSNEYDLSTSVTLVGSQSNDPWSLPALPRSTPQTPKLTYTSSSRPPSLTLKRLSSLDQFMGYQEDKKLWKRESFVSSAPQLPDPGNADHDPMPAAPAPVNVQEAPQMTAEKVSIAVDRELDAMPEPSNEQNKFRHFAAEVGFCFTIAMTQLLAEYLISGFAIVLPNLFDAASSEGAGMTGLFWPAALLSLILSAFLLIFARVSDMYGGYGPFMFGLIWLTIWTLIPGFVSSSLLLNVARANQGLAIAAFTPSTFSMVGSLYPEGPRRNVVLGLYGACAPLGFFAGFLAGGALPADESRWYFWIASALAFVTTVTAYLSVPHDRTDRKRLNLKMDWLGAFLITSGLILVTYSLSVQPYVNADDPTRNGFTFTIVYAPFSSGAACLAIAFWVEGWYASCPLLPFEFFKPQGVKPFSIACLFFYGSFGVWLYNSAE